MSYGSGNAGNLLADKQWRRRHSAWLLAPILGCGLLSFVGFVYCAVRINNPRWWKIAAITTALTIPGYVLMTLFTETDPTTGESKDIPGPGDDIAVGYVLALYAGLVIYALVVNREYLRWRAGETDAQAWYNQPTGQVPLAAPPTQRAPVQPPPRHAVPGDPGVLGVDRADYYAATTPPTAPQAVTPPPPPPSSTHAPPLNVNAATAREIVSVVGLDASTAERIVAARERQRGFQHVDDLVAAAGLQPHELLKLRGKVAFGTFTSAAPATAPAPPTPPTEQDPPPERRGGRILDF